MNTMNTPFSVSEELDMAEAAMQQEAAAAAAVREEYEERMDAAKAEAWWCKLVSGWLTEARREAREQEEAAWHVRAMNLLREEAREVEARGLFTNKTALHYAAYSHEAWDCGRCYSVEELIESEVEAIWNNRS